MENFATKVLSAKIPEGEVGVFFLGQAGFVFKTPQNTLIAVDPYLSDCCNRYFGFKRLMPYILEAHELEFDYLVASHAHYDHFDPDSVPALMGKGKTQFIGALDTKEECQRLGLTQNVTFVSVGESVAMGDATLTAVRCDHGEGTPHALGFVLTVGSKKIYMMGDTAYRPEWYKDALLQNADLLILPINGAFGNLDAVTGAKAVADLTPRLAVPCHYWNFAQHYGSPADFMAEMEKICPKQKYTLLRQGEELRI
ncbi:MAG: MBL fold metallo-hydrolase [Clostridia bacterium]|nr:MBL fold metallo-hydrolase [Clostridia bacterium]